MGGIRLCENRFAKYKLYVVGPLWKLFDIYGGHERRKLIER